MNIKRLKEKALKLRIDTFNAFIKKGEAHLGGSFSMIEIFLTLFEIILKRNDKFILSKSHSSYPMSIYLRQKGFKTKLTTHLEIDVKNKVFCTTGSLGHGFPIATGMAIARKKLNKKGKIYVLVSDGECQEGTTWESLLIGSKHKLDNLVLIVDYNKIQALSKLKDALPLDDIYKKFRSFKWNCIKVTDGHSFKSLINKFNIAQNSKKPTVIVVNTVKGKGVKEFENNPIWHARQLKGSEIDIGRKRLKI